MSIHQKIAIVILDVILIAELCFTMYLASKDPENLTPIFLKYFIFVMIPTFFAGSIFIRRFKSKEIHVETTGHPIKEEKVAEQMPRQEDITTSSLENQRTLAERYRTFAQVTRSRSLLGKVAAVFLLIFIFALLESCVARIKQPLNVLHLLPGTSTSINGQLEKKFKIEDLTYISTSDFIKLTINEIYSGFWVGGNEWSGTLEVSPHIKPAEYRLTVFPKNYKELKLQKPPLIFQIFVHQDRASLQKSSTSIIRKYTGYSPWWVIGSLFLLTGISFLAVFRLSGKIDQLMAKNKMAEVYWSKYSTSGYEVAFGLGRKHGVKVGDRLILFDDDKKQVGSVMVSEVSDTEAVAIVGGGLSVSMGYIVLMKN